MKRVRAAEATVSPKGTTVSAPRLDVVEIETGKVVHSVKLHTPVTAQRVEMALRGLLRNMDTERFLVREVNCP